MAERLSASRRLITDAAALVGRGRESASAKGSGGGGAHRTSGPDRGSHDSSGEGISGRPNYVVPDDFVPLGASPLYVPALAGGGYAALSPICTHRGCTLNVEGTHLVCPCHVSTFDRRGRVLRGPADRPLEPFPVAVTPAGELVIPLESGR